MRPKLEPKIGPDWRTPLGIPHPRSFTVDGLGPVNQHPTQGPSLPLSIMSISTPTSTPTTPPTPTSSAPTSSPSSLSLASLSWAFGPISNATTCTNVSINWEIFNTPSDLSAIFTSTSVVDFAVAIFGLGSSNVSVPLKTQGSAEQVLGGSMRLEWFANVPAGFYDITGIATADVEQGSSPSGNASPSIETAFTVHKGDDTSCIPSNFDPSPSSSSNSDSQTGAQPHSNSNSNAGAIAGGVVGGILALALLTAGLLFFFKRRQQHRRPRRASSSGDRDGYNGKGWNGLSSVGSITSPNAVLAKADVFEKRPSISSIPSPYPTPPTRESFSDMLVQEPGSPPGSPASVELANLPHRRPTIGTIGAAAPRRSMSGTTTHSLNPFPDPFATPIIPGTPRTASSIGHNAGSRSGSGSEAEFDGGEGYDTPSDTSSTKQRAAATLYAPSSLTPGSTKRASHHSRKPVPAYDELNLTSEEKEALGGARRASGSTRGDRDNDEDVSQKSSSPLSVQSPVSSLHASASSNNNNVNAIEESTDHDHALALFKSLRSKSSGHMKGEAYVHYLIPDPPLGN